MPTSPRQRRVRACGNSEYPAKQLGHAADAAGLHPLLSAAGSPCDESIGAVSPAGRVLVVDDDSDIRAFMAMLLEDAGFAVETAVHGGDALARAQTRRPDLVILDLRMPIMSGWEFIAVWRADSVMQGIPIIVTSAEVSVTTARDLGVHAFVRKPVDVERLLMTVQALLHEGGEDGRPG